MNEKQPDRELILARVLEKMSTPDDCAESSLACSKAKAPDEIVAEIDRVDELDEHDFSSEELQQLLQAGNCLRLLTELGNTPPSTDPHSTGSTVRSLSSNGGNDSTKRSLDFEPSNPGRHATNFPEQIGRFEVQDIAGRGGFAVVYKAYDPVLQRSVALKVPLPEKLDTDSARVRFQKEAQLAAMLAHPGIVPIYESDIADGHAFISMGWVSGITLHQLLKNEGQMPISEAVLATRRLADAVAHAHQRGVMHRDLKPANILIECDEDEITDWFEQLRITDFGLAREMVPENALTVEGSILGTPAYMSPEQARCDTSITAATDVWALGVILYELLTGQSPFRRDAYVATLKAVENDDPAEIQLQRKNVSNDLAAIIEKCLQKDPADRYPTAFELSEDLRKFSVDLPVSVRKIGWPGKLKRWSKRNPLIAGSLGVTFFSLVLTCVLVTTFWFRASHDRSQSIEALDAANRSRRLESLALQKQKDALEREQLARAEIEKESQRNRDKLEFLVDAFDQVNPFRLGKAEVSSADLLRHARQQAHQRFGDDPLALADVLSALARSFNGLGMYHDGVECRAEVVEILESNLGPDHVQTIHGLGLLAAAQYKAGLSKPSLKNRREQLRRLRRLSEKSPDHERRALTKLGEAFLAAGDESEYVETIDELLGEQSEMDGGPTRAMVGLKIKSLKKAGLLDDALELSREEVKVCVEIFGEAHPKTFLARAQLVSAFSAKKMKNAALKHSQLLCENAELHLGSDSPLALSLVRLNGKLLNEHKKFTDAIAITDKALVVGTPRFGATHPIMIGLRRCNAAANWKLGNRAEAIEMIERLYQQANSTLGKQHMNTLLLAELLSRWIRESGDLQRSIDLSTSTGERAKKRYGNTSRIYLRLRHELYHSLNRSRRFEEATDLTRELVSLRIDEHGEAHRASGQARLQLIHDLIHTERFTEAIDEIRSLQIVLRRNRLFTSKLWIESSALHSLVLLETGDVAGADRVARNLLRNQGAFQPWMQLMLCIRQSVATLTGEGKKSGLRQLAALEVLGSTLASTNDFHVRWLILDTAKRIHQEFIDTNQADKAEKAKVFVERFESQFWTGREN